ncbi:SDR family oxidoreductase [Mycolicibacterium peregrinum]|uniref:SDR family oxidoreductase n=1 Tax=Mycolicibacterium peregrinum TaxID=43304 RepID=A0A4Z0HW18_MYCPR|nr:SDR family oxidoreductase [Mycolicibacterium peregrinum]TGB43073.1 SDR family oxidoreductase [Mycolicibacterium peregrinum]TGB44156.1 SDR family oxidoreductase [Mycolicibacterium peregrinum]
MGATDLIAITGASGHIGRIVSRLLSSAGARTRLVVRDPNRVSTDSTNVKRATYSDRDAAIRALTGVDALFVVSAAESADRLEQHRTFIDAAAAAGVHHVVYTSFLGAAPKATFTLARDHWETEEHLRTSGMNWTILRDSFYLDFLPTLAGDDGVIRGPAGVGRVGAVARVDVARSAAAVLADLDSHAGQTYDLTGPEALDLTQVARTITEVTGRATTYQQERIEEAYASRHPYGVPEWQLDAWVSTYTAIAAGELALLTDTVERLTGLSPLNLIDVLLSP